MYDWTQRRDEGGRLIYPPLPTNGGNPNAEAKEGVIAGVSTAFQRTRQQEAEFRARQYARRLKTRGVSAMRGPTPEEATPPPQPVEIPDDPMAQALAAAGWL